MRNPSGSPTSGRTLQGNFNPPDVFITCQPVPIIHIKADGFNFTEVLLCPTKPVICIWPHRIQSGHPDVSLSPLRATVNKHKRVRLSISILCRQIVRLQAPYVQPWGRLRGGDCGRRHCPNSEFLANTRMASSRGFYEKNVRSRLLVLEVSRFSGPSGSAPRSACLPNAGAWWHCRPRAGY